jgi:hypothetical protein
VTTPAEQAVIVVLEGDSACTWHLGCDVEDCYGPRAAAIVAALRPILVAEALTQLASTFEAAGLTDAASILREGVEKGLRSTTPTEGTDPR